MVNSGKNKIEWVSRNMPILNTIKEDFEKTKPFLGKKITICIHLEAKTAYFATVLKAGGAEVTATGCNPLSTQDDVAAALREVYGITVYGKHGETEEEYFNDLRNALSNNPDIIMDDGGDLTNLIHSEYPELIKTLQGGTEETTTGILRLKARERAGELKFPVISANDAYCKYLFDNRYGTGQSVWDGINRTTNLIVSSKYVVVAGYGWCGKGTAMRAKGLGAKVIVCEVDPIKAVEAVMDGFSVMSMEEASKVGDIFVTVTGCKDVITKKHLLNMKDGVILANAGHFDVEINKNDLMEISDEKKVVRNNIEGYFGKDGKIRNLLAEGRLVNLAAGDGHPAEIMDMSFSIQALSLKYINENYKNMENKVYNVPDVLDKYVANIKLKSLGVSIDTLSKEQEEYINNYME
ncbi:MAG: adenosylhomocysteinase [Ruminococcaceae bacterium]|nr:adenosylhomocysteinase [Oscillospiraceae bacterium]